MIEPDACINTDAESTYTRKVGFEAIDDSKMGKSSSFAYRSEDLVFVQRVSDELCQGWSLRLTSHNPATPIP